jgi:hypothetical protein
MTISLKTSTIVAVSLAVGLVIAAQPNMQLALASLIQADNYLAKAADNKGGHKARARSLIAAAIIEVRRGMKFAK